MENIVRNNDNYLILYGNLMQEKQELERDVILTEKLIKDSKIYFMDKRDYQNEIIANNKRIAQINFTLNEMAKFLKNDNIERKK